MCLCCFISHDVSDYRIEQNVQPPRMMYVIRIHRYNVISNGVERNNYIRNMSRAKYSRSDRLTRNSIFLLQCTRLNFSQKDLFLDGNTYIYRYFFRILLFSQNITICYIQIMFRLNTLSSFVFAFILKDLSIQPMFVFTIKIVFS